MATEQENFKKVLSKEECRKLAYMASGISDSQATNPYTIEDIFEFINNKMNEAYKAGMESVSNITEKHNEYIKALTAQEIFDCFEDGVLKTQERIKQRIECEKIAPIQKKYDTWASGLEDGVLELEWLFAWMADNKAKYLKPKKWNHEQCRSPQSHTVYGWVIHPHNYKFINKEAQGSKKRSVY